MPDGVANTFEPDDFEWHDGNLVDLQLAGFVGEPRELRMTIDLYPSDDPQAQLQRYLCVGRGLSRFLVSGDMARITKHVSPDSFAGNIDFARMDQSADTEILVVVLFGGMIEAEASTFEFTEIVS